MQVVFNRQETLSIELHYISYLPFHQNKKSRAPVREVKGKGEREERPKQNLRRRRKKMKKTQGDVSINAERLAKISRFVS